MKCAKRVKGRKGKVSVQAPKAQSGIGGMAPPIHNLSTRETTGTGFNRYGCLYIWELPEMKRLIN